MRIAFTSCFSAVIDRQQPVWEEVARATPDVLVLLGDAIYMDCIGGGIHMDAVQAMGTQEFAEQMQKLYARQLALPGFQAVVADAAIQKHAVWDDHDFAWDNATGKEIAANPKWKEFLGPSRFYFQAFRDHLRTNGTDAFPTSTQWSAGTPAPLYAGPVKLMPDVWLHLLDCRSERRRGRTMIGKRQMDDLAAAVTGSKKDVVHLIASSTTFEQNRDESWLDMKKEHDALAALGVERNVLLLTGDIHKVAFTPYPLERGRTLYEATASGAGVKTKVTSGTLLRNFGLVDIDPHFVTVKFSQAEGNRSAGKATISRADWKLAP